MNPSRLLHSRAAAHRFSSSKSILSQRCFSTSRRTSQIHPEPNSSASIRERTQAKYAERLAAKAKENGVGIEELRAKAMEKLKEREKLRSQEIATKAAAVSPEAQKNTPAEGESVSKAKPAAAPRPAIRKDGSPIKPLDTILNLQKLMATPHTPAQISALWQTYHASRSGGTGAGYICASIPLDLYKRMEEVASRYPAFVFPLPRQAPAGTGAQPDDESAAHEFFFMQWDFFDAPPTPSASEPDLFTPPTAASTKNPRTSAILFTSLEEYKLRGSFATPYLVITNYTDLAESHGVVLLRGEITPSKSGQGFMLPQQDAQILAMGLQKFYLWNQEGGSDTATQRLLKTFHEKPEEFKWEELLEQSKLTA